MYKLKLGQFNKRVNSTARPDVTLWDSYDVYLKHETDYDAPYLILEEDFSNIATKNYNYAVIFSRWYWITEIRVIRTGVCQISLSLDVLATYQSAIKGTKAFIEYGLNSFNAGTAAYRIADTRRPVGKNPIISESSINLTGGAFSGNGVYILQAVSNSGGVKCFALSAFQLTNLLDVLAITIEGDIDTIKAAHDMSALVDLIGYNYKQSLLAESGVKAIKSIHWLPLHATEISGNSEEIFLGDYGTERYGTRIVNNYLWSYSNSLSIPWSAADWKRNNTQISIYIPFFGTIPFPIDQCINQTQIDYTLSLDVLSGDLAIRITSGSQTIYTGTTNVSAPYAFGLTALSASSVVSGAIQQGSSVLTMASGAVDIGAGIMGMYAMNLGGGAQKAIGGMQSIYAGVQQNLAGMAQTIQPLITSAGSMGGLASLGQDMNIRITGIYYQVINDPDFESLYGHPVFKVDYPVNGFCKTRGFSLSLGTEVKHIAAINAAMDGGVFVED